MSLKLIKSTQCRLLKDSQGSMNLSSFLILGACHNVMGVPACVRNFLHTNFDVPPLNRIRLCTPVAALSGMPVRVPL
jgi:hypothetical protein